MAVAGCSDDGLSKRYAVSGDVTYNGKPVESGSISFYPAGGGVNSEARGASGVIKDGHYSLSTIGGEDGVIPGDYLVGISARTPDMSQAKANADKVGGSYRQDDVAKAYKNAKSGIPLKYESAEGSGLKAKVVAGGNTFNFELKD
jgi:hypothetical protein